MIPQAPAVRLQVPDTARHVVTAPDGKRYVVATFDDRRLGRGYVTAVYPQQNGYLTLYRLVVYERGSETLDEAVEHHIEIAEAIQRGRLQNYIRKS
jgi:hypothetical protein